MYPVSEFLREEVKMVWPNAPKPTHPHFLPISPLPTLGIHESGDAEVRLGGGERIREVRRVCVRRQRGHVDELRSYRVDHGAEGVSVPPAPAKVLHVNTVLPTNKRLFTVYSQQVS